MTICRNTFAVLLATLLIVATFVIAVAAVSAHARSVNGGAGIILANRPPQSTGNSGGGGIG